VSTIVSWLKSTSPRPAPHRAAVRLERVAELFVDTSAWYSVVMPDHPDHAAVATVMAEALRTGTRLITTNLVMAESHALLLHRAERARALAFGRAVTEPSTVVVSSSAELEHAAITDWLMRFTDLDFSLTDAVSFAVMKHRGIDRALTLDAHFSTAGFSVVPPPAPRRRKR
jgi:predicted nucleic acid-binding protein